MPLVVPLCPVLFISKCSLLHKRSFLVHLGENAFLFYRLPAFIGKIRQKSGSQMHLV